MSLPVFSIVVPTFNSETTIRECLESILNQTFENYEVWIIDGVSTDNTLIILKEFAGQHPFIHVVSEYDEGIYDAMNKGIALSKGEWLYFLGSDDRLCDNSVLEKVANDLQKIDGCDFFYGNVRIVGDTSWANNGTIYDGAFSIEKLFRKNICHQAIFYKKSIFLEIGLFNVDYDVSADWDFNHRCFASKSVRYTSLLIANFFGGGQSTRKNSDKFISQDFVLNLKSYYKITYFNHLFKYSSLIFHNISREKILSGKVLVSFYFLFFAFFHSNQKVFLLKSYIHTIMYSTKDDQIRVK